MRKFFLGLGVLGALCAFALGALSQSNLPLQHYNPSYGNGVLDATTLNEMIDLLNGMTGHGVPPSGTFNTLTCTSLPCGGVSGGAAAYDTNIVSDCGADPTDSTDSWAAIQSCIDQVALTNGSGPRSIYCPGGTYKISQPLFLDPPGNLRGADGIHNASGGYSSGNTYAQNDTTIYNGVSYISLVNSNTGNTPASSPSDWAPFNWSSAKTYAQNSVVSFNGIPWISLYNTNLDNVPGQPTSSKIWWLPTTVNQATVQGSFSLTLLGDPGNHNAGTGYGCTIQQTQNFLYNGIWIGPGQGMTLRDLSISGISGAFNQSLLGPNAIGVAVAGGSAGANDTLLQQVEVDNFYTAFKTAANGVSSLGAQNRLDNILFSSCENGWVVGGSQNDINSMENGQIECTNAFISVLGPGIAVRDSNVSDTRGEENSFTISSTSSITYNSGLYSFTTTIASPDMFMTLCFDTTGTIISDATSSGNCTYNSWTLVTKGFGVIPLLMTNWNGSTNVATFEILPNWGAYYFPYPSGGDNALTRSDLQSEIQAQTTIYASQMAVLFEGNAFDARDIHIENNSQCTQLLQDAQGFGGDWGVHFDKLRFNGSYSSPGELSHFLCQMSFPLIDMSQGTAADVDWGISAMPSAGGNPFIFDVGRNTNAKFYMHTSEGGSFLNSQLALINPVIRSTSADNNGSPTPQNGDNISLYNQGNGGGSWNICPFWPNNLNAGDQGVSFGRGGPLGAVPCLGFRPDPNYIPNMGTGTYSILTGMVPGSTPLVDEFPLSGQTIYSVTDYNSVQSFEFQSLHQYYSYGQNLTSSNIGGTMSLAWVGGGFAVSADANTLGWVFPGLGIQLNNGAGYVKYVVTGVYPNVTLDSGAHPGYFTVLNAAQGGPPYNLTGTSGQAYTASQINQDPWVFGIVANFAGSGLPTLSSCGGGSPTAGSGSNNKGGNFTTGSGSPTACTITFAQAYPNVANCTVSPANSAANGISGGTYVSAQSDAAFTITMGTGTSSAKFNYSCPGN